jgi:16S rRNA (guanine966-N2)-methyltransferase
VTLVERATPVLAALRRNAGVLDGARLEIVGADALKFLSAAAVRGDRYDLLFLDPPYRQGWLDRLWSHLSPILTDGARVYVEAEHALVPPAPWQVLRQGQAGQVFYHLLERS